VEPKAWNIHEVNIYQCSIHLTLCNVNTAMSTLGWTEDQNFQRTFSHHLLWKTVLLACLLAWH